MVFMKKILNFFTLYSDGFKNLQPYSKKLWLLIFIKLFVMFAIIKYLFFPNFLDSVASSHEEKSTYIIDQLLKD